LHYNRNLTIIRFNLKKNTVATVKPDDELVQLKPIALNHLSLLTQTI